MVIELLVLLALAIFLILFISIDETIKRNEKLKRISHEKSWIDYKEKLPKYVP